ncbi:alpha/beta hydrolase [Streptomyces sp. NPDC051985]|uniref:alpha/beta fold hydrolase n=1 Tax=Streptomyces sp. NPDC051985 TaxID=3155807 RepID=UPI00343F177A
MTTTTTVPGSAFSPHQVEADGFTIRYFQAGDGDPLLVLHGAGGPQFSLALDLLSDRFRVFLIEMPGFGDQANDRHQTLADMAATIDATAQALGLDAYHLLGTSFGGAVSTFVALNHPQRLLSLVLEAPATFRTGETPPSPDLPPAEMLRRFRRHPERPPVWVQPSPATMAKTWTLVGRLMGQLPVYDEELVARLQECQVRTLVVFGDKDGVIPPDNGRTFRRHMPNCNYILIHDAAHDPQADRPEAYADVVGDFLTRGWLFLLPEESTVINP